MLATYRRKPDRVNRNHIYASDISKKVSRETRKTVSKNLNQQGEKKHEASDSNTISKPDQKG